MNEDQKDTVFVICVAMLFAMVMILAMVDAEKLVEKVQSGESIEIGNVTYTCGAL